MMGDERKLNAFVKASAVPPARPQGSSGIRSDGAGRRCPKTETVCHALREYLNSVHTMLHEFARDSIFGLLVCCIGTNPHHRV
jgi:hypothetical protein